MRGYGYCVETRDAEPTTGPDYYIQEGELDIAERERESARVAMNTVKAIQTSCFPLTRQHYNFASPTRFSSSSSSGGRSRRLLCFCNVNNSGDSESGGGAEGDKRKQELLARIAMLQTQKVRLTDFLDERSEYLTQFAEDANAEFDKIGEDALKELDQAGERIMEKLEGRMQDFEETSDINREEIEKSERVLDEFEDQIVRDRNEGLFFKNLTEKEKQKAPSAKATAKLEADKITEITKDNAGSKLRKNIYLGFMSLLAISIGNAIFATDHDVEWRKVAGLGLIFMGLLSQFIYEQGLSSTSKEIDKKEK